MSTKINQLLRKWPQNTIAAAHWLREQGVTRDLLSYYRRSGWMTGFARGAVIKNGDHADWPGGVYALQEQLYLPIHPGGKTALTLQGFGHYIPLGRERVTLFTHRNVRVPQWFTRNDWPINLHIFKTNLFPPDCTAGLKKLDMGNFLITVSTAERAIMEVLYCLPKKESLDETKHLMEGLTSLRPDVVLELLQACTSVKVKRTFMVLAEIERHSWFERLDTSAIDFGSGKRSLIKGGYLHPRDLFDIKMLLSHEGITNDIRRAFVVYLACHDRPMHEVLAPALHDMRTVFDNEFEGLTTEAVTYEELETARSFLIKEIHALLLDTERRFLLSIKTGEPQWNLLPVEGIENLPALQWKLTNIRRMDKTKHRRQVNMLKETLQL
jgi:hypothetical protein